MSTAHSPSTEMSKSYDPAAVEAEVYDFWLKNNCFTADPSRDGEPYSIVIPPPNVTGALHLGHAINNTLQDILTRTHRMRGFNTVWIPGIDHAGIATQAVVEKQLKEKENKTRHDVGREGLVERIWAWKQQYGDRILSQLQRLGCSCDWSRTRFTLDEMCAKAVRETFFKLFKDGLVYRGKRLVNWDTHLLTSISDDELYTETTKTSMWHIKYKIVDGPSDRGTGFQPVSGSSNLASSLASDSERIGHGLETRATDMVVATTRPETLLADTAVAVHPDDPRWNWAIGKHVRLPLTNRLIPIIGDPILVDMAFGSGVVKVTPAHDPNDYAVYSRHLGTATEIAILNLMTPDGRVNDADASWSAYTGLTFKDARKKIVDDLIAGGFMTEADIKPHEANVSFSDRSKTAIQPYLSDQWFVKMAPLAEPALDVVRDGTIKFYPERHAQQYLSWLGEKRDWPISRQLWWGHRIPVWSKVIKEGDSFAPSSPLSELARLGRQLIEKQRAEGAPNPEHVQLAGASISKGPGPDEYTIFKCFGPNEDADARDWEQRLGFVQDPDVLDTWFSSALWPHSTLGWPDRTADLAKWYPTSVLLTGRDIITLWVARMVMMGMYNMGAEKSWELRVASCESETAAPHSQPATHNSQLSGIPFHAVVINPTILDGKGERMSKSKGNGVDPVDIIDSQGADALRFTLTQMATETQDVRLPVKKNADGKNTSDKFDAGRNFCTKLWNAAKFALTNIANAPTAVADVGAGSPRPGGGTPPLQDRWIISRFNQTVTDANAALSSYRFDQYAKAVYDFFWRDFCDWYVEAAKPAMKDPARSAAASETLAAILDGALRLMHPMIPFITEKIWWQLNAVRPQRGVPGLLECPASDKLIFAAWPTAGAIDTEAEHVFPRLQAVIQTIRNVRSEYNVNPKITVSVHLSLPGEAAVRQADSNREMIELLATCRIEKIGSGLTAPADAATGTGDGFEVFALNLIDPDAEAKRVAKLRDDLTKKITALKGRLANPAYADKAPVHLVQQTRDELAAFEAELAKLG